MVDVAAWSVIHQTLILKRIPADLRGRVDEHALAQPLPGSRAVEGPLGAAVGVQGAGDVGGRRLGEVDTVAVGKAVVDAVGAVGVVGGVARGVGSREVALVGGDYATPGRGQG